MTKFNIIGNPPYIGKGEKFYLRVMSECEKFADSAVWIVPTDFVDNPRIKENINNKHIAILNERFESFDRIETVIGDAKFDEAAFFSDVGIFVFSWVCCQYDHKLPYKMIERLTIISSW